MTREQIVPAYMKLRRELLEKGAPLGDWTVSVSPADAADLNLHVEALEKPVGDGSYVYGATWVTDAEVPVGELWLTIQARATKHVIKIPS